MPLVRPTPEIVSIAANRLASTQADLEHLSRYSYCDSRFPSESAMRGMLSQRGVLIFVSEKDGPVGFVLYPTPIAHQLNSFGMGIALGYAGRGYAKAALREFVARCPEFGITDLHGYCRNDNAAMIRVLEACGFQHVAGFRDPLDSRALHYRHPLHAQEGGNAHGQAAQ